MTKRKQPEPIVRELDLEEGTNREASQCEEPSSGEVTSVPAPIETTESVAKGNGLEETIWTLMEKVGYLVW